MLPSFSHINELYELVKGKHEKMAYKISEQVLHPQVIEKSSVKMAELVFHESTINARSIMLLMDIIISSIRLILLRSFGTGLTP